MKKVKMTCMAILASFAMVGAGVATFAALNAESVVEASAGLNSYTFTSKAWADSSNAWTSDKDGNEKNGQGVQVTSGVSGAGATTKASLTNVSNVTFTYSTNSSKGVGSISVKVGSGEAILHDVTKEGGTSDRTLSFDFAPAQSGKVQFVVTCTTNSIYVKSVSIAGTEKTIQGISISGGTLAKTAYFEGQAFDPTGLTFQATWSSGDPTPVDGAAISWGALHAGDTTATGTYQGKSVTVEGIAVQEDTLQSIAISGSMTKTEYTKGSDWNPAGLVVTGTYASGKEEVVTNSVAWTYEPAKPSNLETTSVEATATCEGKNASVDCDVTVVKAPSYYVIQGPTGTGASSLATKETLEAAYPTSETQLSWQVPVEKVYVSSTQALKIGTGSATGTVSLALDENASINLTKVVVNAQQYGSDSSKMDINGQVFDLTSSKANYTKNLSAEDKIISISNNQNRLYVYSISVYFEYKPAELSANPSSFDLNTNSNQAVALSPRNFPTAPEYTKQIVSGSSIALEDVAIDGNNVTITSHDAIGQTVVRITGTEDEQTAYVDITVNVVAPRTLDALEITKASTDLEFYEGAAFSVSGLEITASFSDSTQTVYNAANANFGLLTFDPEIGSVLTVGAKTVSIYVTAFGNETKVNYAINVLAKPMAAKITNVQDLWDGQQIYFTDGVGHIGITHAGGSNMGTEAMTIDPEKGLSYLDLELGKAYTVIRKSIGETIYYAFEFDGFYLVDTGDSENNKLGRTETLTDACFWTIQITDGVASITNKSNTQKPTLRYNATSSIFSCYKSDTTQAKPTLYAVESYGAEKVGEAFASRHMHMADYTEELGYCKDNEHGYYAKAKPAYLAMSDDERAAIPEDAMNRFRNWAKANGDIVNINGSISTGNGLAAGLIQGPSSTAIIVLTIVSAAVATTGALVIIIRRRKKKAE